MAESVFAIRLVNLRSVTIRTKISKKMLEALGEFSTVMQTLDFVSGLHNCLEFSRPLSGLYQAMQKRKTFSIA